MWNFIAEHWFACFSLYLILATMFAMKVGEFIETPDDEEIEA